MASESLQGCVIDLRNFALKKQNNFIFKQNMWLETSEIETGKIFTEFNLKKLGWHYKQLPWLIIIIEYLN